MREKGESPVTKAMGIGELFQEETKYTPENLGGYSLDMGTRQHRTRIMMSRLQELPFPRRFSPAIRISGRRLSAEDR